MLLLLVTLVQPAPAADWNCQARGVWQDCALRDGIETCSDRAVTGHATHSEQASAAVRAQDSCALEVQQRVLAANARDGGAHVLFSGRHYVGCEVTTCTGPTGQLTPMTPAVPEPYVADPQPLPIPSSAGIVPECRPMLDWMCGECGQTSPTCVNLTESPLTADVCMQTWSKLTQLIDMVEPEVLRPKLCRMYQ